MSDSGSLKNALSISGFTKDKGVKSKFNEWFVKPRLSRRFPIIHPPITDKPQLLGIAFYYLLHFKLQYLNSKAHAMKWVAEHGLLVIKFRLYTKNYTQSASKKALKS